MVKNSMVVFLGILVHYMWTPKTGYLESRQSVLWFSKTSIVLVGLRFISFFVLVYRLDQVAHSSTIVSHLILGW